MTLKVLVAVACVGLLSLLVAAWFRQRPVLVPGTGALASFDAITPSMWEALSRKRILFGHMSVGEDILAGAQEILREHPEIPLRMHSWSGERPLTEAGLWHARVGFNGDPIRKLERFKELLLATQTAAPDIALIKLCYVDVRARSEPTALRQAYGEFRQTVAGLFPQTRLLPVTVPLQSPPPSLKLRLKQGILGFLGRADTVADNARREEYNRWLREEHSGKGPLLDLATIEATSKSGRCAVRRDGSTTVVMRGEYTTDGGHLNAAGRRHVAEQFLIALAQTADLAPRPASPTTP